METLKNIINKIELKKQSKNLVRESFKSLYDQAVKEALTYTPILKIASDEPNIAEYDMNDGQYSEEKYRNTTGYYAKFFDVGTGNFHIMPKEDEILLKCSETITKKYNEIEKVLQKTVPDVGWEYKKHPCTAQTQYHKLFCFFTVTVGNERNYDLMFFRMSLDEKAKNVSCILKSIQYECSRGNLQSCTIYPESLEDGCEKTDDKGNCYYNPCVRFNDDADTIVNDFINFIKEKEENYKSSES